MTNDKGVNVMAYKNPIPSVDNKNTQFSNGEAEVSVKKHDENLENDYISRDLVYFAFIDVLGFKKTFDDNRQNNKDDFADKYRKVFNYYFELIDAADFMKNQKVTGCYAGQTSDSLYFYTPRIDMLIDFIKLYSHFNLYAMSQDVFFRGGIAKGRLYTKKDYQFYGDSVMYAYLLESSISKNPIIVIDESTYDDMRKIGGLDRFIVKESRHYIKPFAFLEEEFELAIDDKFVLKEIDVDKIRKNILMNMSFFEYDAKNYEKYTFLNRELKNLKILRKKTGTHKEEKK